MSGFPLRGRESPGRGVVGGAARVAKHAATAAGRRTIGGEERGLAVRGSRGGGGGGVVIAKEGHPGALDCPSVTEKRFDGN